MAACTRPSGSDAKGGFSAKCHYLQAVISAHVMGEQLQKALGFLVAADLVPNAITYNAAISAHAKGEQWQKALSLLAAVQGSELLPNVITYSSAIRPSEVDAGR